MKDRLLAPVSSIFRDGTRPEDERFQATVILEHIAADNSVVLVNLIKDADKRQFTILLPLLRRQREAVVGLLTHELLTEPAVTQSEQARNDVASRVANCAVTLLALGEPDPVWPLLAEPRYLLARGFLLDRIESAGVDPRLLAGRLKVENAQSIRRSLMLVLADYKGKGLDPSERAELELDALRLFEADPDPGVHSAAELLLRQYGHAAKVDAVNERLKDAKQAAGTGRRWYVNSARDTMLIIDPRGQDPALSRGRKINRAFAMASKEVSVQQFLKFRSEADYQPLYSPTPDCPVNCITWYDAAAYCRWLSQCDKIPEHEMCYPPIPEIKDGIRLPADYLTRTGYRLPTEAESEYACRAGTYTSRFYGTADSLLTRYAFFRENSKNHSWPVGSLWPNDFGLFDILGNMLEWCQEGHSYTARALDLEDTRPVINTTERVVHSGSYDKIVDLIKSDRSETALPAAQFNSIGFRIVRTLRDRP